MVLTSSLKNFSNTILLVSSKALRRVSKILKRSNSGHVVQPSFSAGGIGGKAG